MSLGSSLERSRPARHPGKAPLVPLAAASGFVQIAVGGGLLVWTDGATIWGLVLPAD